MIENSFSDSRKDKFSGCVLGLAIGDALGFPAEFLDIHQIYHKFGPEGVTDFFSSRYHPQGTFTDDTQMSLAIANALITVGNRELIQRASVEIIMTEISNEFVKWAFSPENNRAPGRTCMTGCGNLKEGIPWRESGVAGSKGCGSAMRSTPIGLVFHNNHAKLKEVGIASSITTHGHPCALAGSVATAYLVALAVNNEPPEKYIDKLCEFTADISDEFVAKISYVPNCLAMESEEAFQILGNAWVAEEAVADALYCFLRSPTDYKKTVLTAANSNGDSDSIACIAGAISGAYNGIASIPQKWIEEIEKSSHLKEIAEELFRLTV
ncbi:MAG: ADP-ribosylglycohydrolase family protein [Planctomycetota bacterium]